MAWCSSFWTGESYPRLVPWEFVEQRWEIDTSLTVTALSHTCNLDRKGNEVATETFDRVGVRETPETVTFETWLGRPQGPGFSRSCQPVQGYGFMVGVELASPLRNRVLIDPACELEGDDRLRVCRHEKAPSVPEWRLQMQDTIREADPPSRYQP